MDQNRFVPRMLFSMYNATEYARRGETDKAIGQWQELRDNYTDMIEQYEKDGTLPTFLFNFELFD